MPSIDLTLQHRVPAVFAEDTSLPNMEHGVVPLPLDVRGERLCIAVEEMCRGQDPRVTVHITQVGRQVRVIATMTEHLTGGHAESTQLQVTAPADPVKVRQAAHGLLRGLLRRQYQIQAVIPPRLSPHLPPERT